MRRALLGTVAAAALAAAGVLLPASTASAALGDCPQGQFCVWDDDNYSSARMGWGGNDPNWHDDGWGDRADSLYNNGTPATYDDVRVYMDVNYVNEDLCVVRGDYYDWGMDDNDYSSHQWTASC
ncbi:peptidase inhibitor family I36 protein [Streptomyces longwoodensis]|uniref:peptidase inhibitor family I36 protein n=1 Tax=Streptomyces longwoodensis TaxID=68231 RepID=UPI002ED08330|nr:peptidase inhibitor family I36 protein [Streptomyces longwoodensis]